MADWDCIECGFNSLDETLNFGTRNFAGIDNLYETTTLASLKNVEGDPSAAPPNIEAVIQNGLIFFAINKTMRVFRDLLCSELAFNVTFDQDIDAFSVTPNGKYLLLCLRSGAVHCFDIDEGTMIYESSILDNDAMGEPLFVNSFVEKITPLSFLLVLNSGKIFRVARKQPPVDDSTSESLEFTPSMVYDGNKRIHKAAYVNNLLFMMERDYLVYQYNLENAKLSSINISLKKAFPCNNRLFLGLNWDGRLSCICTKTFLTFDLQADTLFEDILLIHDNTYGSHILGVTKKNESGQSYIQLLSYPEFTTVFSLKISGKIHLITPERIHDEIMFISEVESGENVCELRFQIVTETSPENRLKRLVRRQRFAEAEQFAKLFNLDLAEIQKAKAQAIVDKTVCDKTDIENLINILNDIDDYVFKIQSCLNVHAFCSTLEIVETVLKYGCCLELPEGDEDFCEETQYLQILITELMLRFNMFMVLVRCGRPNSSIQDWVDFSVCDLIDELNLALEHDDIQQSIIIYSRLDTTTILKLEEKQITEILNRLNSIPMEKQLPFLNTFVPLTLNYLPATLSLFIDWITEKVFQIETKQQSKFPDNAIEFINKMIHFVSFQQQHMSDQKSTQDLAKILRGLERLRVLKSDFRLVISLKQFLQGTETLVQTLLTMAIHSVESEYFVEDFIRKFMLDNQLEPDDIFADVVKDIVKYEEEYWIKVVSVILNCIGSLDKKLEATIVVLKAANVPWCSAVREIARASLQHSHPLVKEIVQEIEYEPKCVILKKTPYNIAIPYINLTEYLRFAIDRIIYCNEPTMMEDIYQLCIDAKEKHEADVLLINHFICIGDFKNALSILDNSDEYFVKCCKKFIALATVAIENEFKIQYLQDNYYQIISPVYQRLRKRDSEFEILYLQESVENLKSVYNIRKNFNMDITFCDVEMEVNKKNVFQSLISQVILEFQESSNILSCLKKCEKVSTFLRMDKTVVLLMLCKQVGDFEVILKAAEEMFLCNPDSVALCQIVTLILKHIGSSSAQNGFQDSIEKCVLRNIDKIDLTSFTRGLKLAREMVVRAILNCDSNYLSSCMELANWVETMYHSMQDDKRSLSPGLMKVYGCDIILPSISAFNALKSVFDFYAKLMDSYQSPNTRYLTKFHCDIPKLNETQVVMEIQSLQSTIKCLCTEGHALTAYKLLVTLQRGLVQNFDINADLHNNLNEIIDQSTKQLLHNIFAARHIDKELAYNLLLSCDVTYSKGFLFKSLKYFKRDVLKFESIAQICLRFLLYYEIKDGQFLCTNIVNLAKWWKKLKTCSVPYDEFFRKSPDQVLENLIRLNNLDIPLVEEFCCNFALEVQKYYHLYLKNLLINWKADHEFQTDLHGKKCLVVKNNEDQLLSDCMEVIDVIQNKESVFSMVDRIWDKINFYHYEVFMCILKIQSALQSCDDNDHKNVLLIFLKNYQRDSKPGQTEIEQWYTLYPDTQSIDFLSEWRLPFTPTLFTNKIWSIIRPEINLKTYTQWFEAISILKKYLSKDDICSYVIKEVIASGVFQTKNADDWILHPRHESLLQEIDMCMQNMINYEQATSAVYSLITNIPGGADRVNAAGLSYKYAQKYQKQFPQSDDVKKAVIKVQKKYYSYSTIHILYANQLADKKYLDMVARPVDELIETLYMDERILRKTTYVTLFCPNINKAVDELAALHVVNAQEKRYALLNNWLSLDTTTADLNFDTGIYMSTGDQNRYKNDECSDSLIRASYICTSGDVATWRAWLFKLAQSETSESKKASFKAMALKCLCYISDPDIVEDLTDTPYEEVRIYINKLMLISGLEGFGFSLTIESLDQCNKYELLNRLSYHMMGPIGAKIMASVCITYTIEESKYWAPIINTMLKLNLIKELKECLDFFKKYFSFQTKKYYIEAWQAVVNDFFDFPPKLPEATIRNSCIENFYVIQACPVLFALDLEYAAKQCLEVKQYCFVALILQYLTKEKQELYIKEILKCDVDIYRHLEELNELGFWGASYVKSILTEYPEGNTDSVVL